MCYHYSITKTASEIAKRYQVDIRQPVIDPVPVFYHTNGFNHTRLPVVYQDYKSSQFELEFMQWGLVPGWIKGEEQALKIRGATLNARSETANSKPAFRGAFRYRPCLVPATGYFEWMHQGGKKYPFFIYLPDHTCFSFAGIWEEWVNEVTGEILRSFSILTCDANDLTATIHNTKKRMPVIIDNSSSEIWMDSNPGRVADREKILKPYPAEKMDAYSISRLITARDRDSNIPGVLEPYQYPELH